ncbi:MAG: Na+/H+ antiporter NhaC family protein [Planctomycetes bacterium]|nr:Na+/H+ antiporter NhaC family protein [Planctomycetota bacterium]
MTGSLRYLLAAAFVLAYFLVPAADDRELADIQTRSWLMGDDSPFTAAVVEGADGQRAVARALGVSYLAGATSVEERRERAEALARTLREWARGQAGLTTRDDLPPPVLEVVVGDHGFLATLTAADGRELGRREVRSADSPAGRTPDYYPDRRSLLPAVLAIALAIATGRVIWSLLAGCLAGAMVHRGAVVDGAWHFASDTLARDVFGDRFYFEILGFVVFLFMTVGVMARGGGVQGMVEWIRGLARGPISTQLCSFAIGILIFFDDYSNCIIAGTTMRPLTDRNRVSREKLAYIVDATAAPVAGVSIFSTWVAYEVSTFATQLPEVTRPDGAPYEQSDGFAVFVQTLPYRFYCLFTLVMVLLTIVLRREFGPMLKAARRAWTDHKPVADDARPMVSENLTKTEPPPGVPHRGLNALLPIMLLVGMTVALIAWFGYSAIGELPPGLPWFERVVKILGEGQSQRALCWSSGAALLFAIALVVSQRILTLREAVLSALRSASSLLFAIVILVLAWGIGQTCRDLGTAPYLTAAFRSAFEPWLLPVVMFLLSSVVAFSTGTSYGTMAILLPNVVVLAHGMGEAAPELGGPGLMVLTIGAVLEGSIFGDHCSPISDTTVLSSVATGSDHLHHVRTQAPYALLGMCTAVVAGYVPVALLGLDAWPLAWLAGAATIATFLLVFGRDPTRAASAPRGQGDA